MIGWCKAKRNERPRSRMDECVVERYSNGDYCGMLGVYHRQHRNNCISTCVKRDRRCYRSTILVNPQ
ncbi:hypothetical protein KQX54_001595 [Cotesia glomerata]|uniref:Uncharacterized protein n=1 Tax=Cotesia glomerata TaxID=32391 RepID=A0AAV7HU31_COTGL|nr:hypothetical protein KQX54_001595 [Cotesia glomerata]